MRLGLASAALLVVLAALAFAYPAVAATGCPSCFGFEPVGDDVFVERTMPPEQRGAAKGVVDAARDRVRGFYGSLDGRPRLLLCATQDCYARFGGGSRGIALLDRALFLSPRGTDIVIAAHELAHIELHHRLGVLNTLSKAVPQWFDEGLAVVVSDDDRYLRSAAAGDRCRIEPSGEMPTSRAAWIESAASADLYAKAACRVSRWIAARGGRAGILRLVDDVVAGRGADL